MKTVPVSQASTEGGGDGGGGAEPVVSVVTAESVAGLGTPRGRPALGLTPQGSFSFGLKDEAWRQLFPAGTSTDIVFWRDEENRKHARARDGYADSGWEFADVLQSGLDYVVNTFGGGEALIRPGYYELTSRVDVPQHARLDAAPGAILANHLSDRFAPCVRFTRESSTDRLVVDANGGSGIQLGEPNAFNNLHLGSIRVYGAGDDDGAAGTHVSVDVHGYNVKWDHLDVNGGAVALRIDGADIFGTSAMIVNSAVGVAVEYAEHVVLNDTIADSCTDVGVSLDDAYDLILRGSVWFNATTFTATPRYGLAVGRERGCSHLRLELSHMAHGGTAVHLDRLTSSLVSVLVTNDRPSGPAIPFEAGLVTTDNTADSVVVSGYVDPTIPEPLSVAGGTVTL